MKKNIIIIITALTFTINAQKIKKYYKLPDNQIFTNKMYQHFINSLNIKNQLKFSIKDSVIKQDSLIYFVNIIPLKKRKEKNTIVFNPYEKYNTLIGTRFKIENYIKENGKNFKKKYLNNKPTIINFWFTKCTPCIRELPNLLSIKKELGKNINYLAITFEDRTTVNKFLTKYKFDYLHITNSKKEIENLKINTYPLTMILDSKGVITHLFPDIYNFEKEVIEKLKKLL